MSVKTERDTQAVKIRLAYDYLKARYGRWVPAPEIAAAAQSMAVSTKISQARTVAAEQGEEILWNRDPRQSCYMLRAKRLGRDASEPIGSPWDQDRPFGEQPFTLKP